MGGHHSEIGAFYSQRCLLKVVSTVLLSVFCDSNVGLRLGGGGGGGEVELTFIFERRNVAGGAYHSNFTVNKKHLNKIASPSSLL